MALLKRPLAPLVGVLPLLVANQGCKAPCAPTGGLDNRPPAPVSDARWGDPERALLAIAGADSPEDWSRNALADYERALYSEYGVRTMRRVEGPAVTRESIRQALHDLVGTQPDSLLVLVASDGADGAQPSALEVGDVEVEDLLGWVEEAINDDKLPVTVILESGQGGAWFWPYRTAGGAMQEVVLREAGPVPDEQAIRGRLPQVLEPEGGKGERTATAPLAFRVKLVNHLGESIDHGEWAANSGVFTKLDEDGLVRLSPGLHELWFRAEGYRARAVRPDYAWLQRTLVLPLERRGVLVTGRLTRPVGQVSVRRGAKYSGLVPATPSTVDGRFEVSIPAPLASGDQVQVKLADADETWLFELDPKAELPLQWDPAVGLEPFPVAAFGLVSSDDPQLKAPIDSELRAVRALSEGRLGESRAQYRELLREAGDDLALARRAWSMLAYLEQLGVESPLGTMSPQIAGDLGPRIDAGATALVLRHGSHSLPARIDGPLEIRGIPPGATDRNEDSRVALQTRDGSLVLRGSDINFTNVSFTGVSLVVEGEVTFEGCRFSFDDESSLLVTGPSAHARLRNCHVSGPGGVEVVDAAGCDVLDSLLEGSVTDGLRWHDGGALLLVRTRVQSSQESGISLTGRGGPILIEGCEVEDCGGSGVRIEAGGPATLWGGEYHHNQGFGIEFPPDATPELIGVAAHHNVKGATSRRATVDDAERNNVLENMILGRGRQASRRP